MINNITSQILVNILNVPNKVDYNKIQVDDQSRGKTRYKKQDRYYVNASIIIQKQYMIPTPNIRISCLKFKMSRTEHNLKEFYTASITDPNIRQRIQTNLRNQMEFISTVLFNTTTTTSIINPGAATSGGSAVWLRASRGGYRGGCGIGCLRIHHHLLAQRRQGR